MELEYFEFYKCGFWGTYHVAFVVQSILHYMKTSISFIALKHNIMQCIYVNFLPDSYEWGRITLKRVNVVFGVHSENMMYLSMPIYN